jgi:hypothetical protein
MSSIAQRKTYLKQRWLPTGELEPANEEAADNFLDWEGANAEEATENLDDSLVLMWMRSQMPKTGMIY